MIENTLVLGPGDMIGRYKVARLLGRGSTGSVYLATQPFVDRPVAVKVLLHADDRSRERFRDEARKLAATEHPNIVEIFDVDEHEGRPFIVMRYVRGRSLRDMAAKEERLPAAVLV